MKRLTTIFILFICSLLIVTPCMAGKAVTKSIGAQNTYSDAVQIMGCGTARISGTEGWSATVVLQRSEDGYAASPTWYDTGIDFTYDEVYPWCDYTNSWYRLGVKTGAYTSGTISVWLGSK